MKTQKELELTGRVGWNEKGHWTLEELSKHLAAQTPPGWVVGSFNVSVVPAPQPDAGTRTRSKPGKKS